MTSAEKSRVGPGRGILCGALCLALAVSLGGCGMDIIGGGGGGEVVDRFRLTVTVTNVGNGFGTADVTFPSGTPQDPCTEVLGPGESCSPSAVASTLIQSAQIEVSAESGSRFVEWTDLQCSGTSSECTVQSQSGEFDVEIEVQPRFDLVEGG